MSTKMNKLFSLLIILIFFTNYSFCQENCKYGEYSYLIIMALDEISFEEYHKANENYRLAFSKVETPFSTDLISALKVAKEIKDTIQIKEFAVMLAKGGIPLEYFKEYNNYKWYPQFESDFENFRTFYKSNFNSKLRSNLLSLRKQDSLFNDNFHKWRKGEIELTLEDLITGATSITKGFEKLVETYGFPCEKRMGYYYENGEIAEFPVKVLLIHIYQRGVLLYKETLSSIVCEGELRFGEEMSLETFRGFGNSTGIEQEMKVRFEKFSNRN